MKFPKSILLALPFLALMSCQESGPKDFLLEKDQCDNCKMTITDLPYGTELITEKGRVYKFDDISCMTMYENSEADKVKNSKKYVIDAPTGKFVELSKATLIKEGNIKSPMGGNTQAFENKEAAQKAATALGATLTN
ncbi:nitrous oxide reductase accessory protein NosL [Kaistella sp. G5-32]|uniref:Nitrous oxide reductase accessory protein NosL n=1 Tax=Kaistella gelatinilytica TaxID=2787636 RepID=A0ABS0FF07_9FLAO|nr:nitrous oxide reductase accessory protein NosL [Kaistella gelatinilytica]MBF8458307.1 nitrous oxide reductase accessory protein NosL [Kaistella gelatinilytica]